MHFGRCVCKCAPSCGVAGCCSDQTGLWP
uniref:Uncharacterized protein n=1 Tax=Anguilla anguilla TaxID=7936 RepID=A0A0E9UID1_ANGAN